MRKAGYHGPVTPAVRSSISLERYQSTIAAVTYDEYCEEVEAAGALEREGAAAGARVALKVAA